MKPALFASLFACAFVSAAPARAADTWTPGTGWTLVWGDEFNGTALDPNNWTFDLGAGGWGNNELQTYTSDPANVTVSGGNLVITAIKNKNKYTSAHQNAGSAVVDLRQSRGAD